VRLDRDLAALHARLVIKHIFRLTEYNKLNIKIAWYKVSANASFGAFAL
jgi:hypothetical protein